MAQIFSKFLHQFWIVLVVALLGLLSIHTSNPIYGAPDATPTPDVQTVPKPIEVLTPTNTPFPTPTASDDSSSPDDGSVATPQPEDEGDNNINDNNNDNHNGGSNNSGATANNSSTSENSAATTATTTGLIGLVNVVTLNVRKGPSADDHIIDKLFLDDQVEVLGRDGAGLWWYVCCGSGTQRAGWVNIQFITPQFAAADAATRLPVLANRAAAAPEQTGETTGASTLRLEMRPLPAFAWQGQTVQLHFVVHNTSNQALSTISLRDDLPPEVVFVSATVDNGGTYSYRGAVESGPLLTIEWPTLPAQKKFTAMVTLQIRSDTATGALIDNLAQVTSAKGEQALAGLTLAMPPLRLPVFR